MSGIGVAALVLFDVLLIVAVARGVGALFTTVGQPRVVGEIVAGILLGPTVLGFVPLPDFLAAGGAHLSLVGFLFPDEVRQILNALGQGGLLLFMFLTGLELDPALLRGRMKGVFAVGVGAVAAPVALGFAIAPVLADELFMARGGSTLGFTLFVGSMLAVTAFPVMARILQEKGLSSSDMGATAVAAAAVVTVLMFMLVSLASSVATGASAGELALEILGAVAYLAAMIGIVRPLLVPLGRAHETRRGTLRIFVAMALVVSASGYAAYALGLSVIVGGFVAGLVMPQPRKALFAAVDSRLGALTARALLPIFLAYSGLVTDFTQLSAAALPAIALFLAAAIVGKWPASAALARVVGLSWAEGNVLGVLMNCRGLLVLVVALMGVQSAVITPTMQLAAVVMALLTTAMTGPLFDAFKAR